MLSNLILKYKGTKPNKGFPRKFNPTHKWVEYSLDIIELNKELTKANFNDKFKILELLTIAERKRKYHYNHPDFNLRDANIILSAVK